MSKWSVFSDVAQERARQDRTWGWPRDHPDGIGGEAARLHRAQAQDRCDVAFAQGHGTWAHILVEEVCEALAADDPDALRTELVQVAAVAVVWAEALDKRRARRSA